MISFDRFQFSLPASVAYDDQVQTHLRYMRHFLTKRTLIGAEFQMTDINTLPDRLAALGNEEKSAYIHHLKENLFEPKSNFEDPDAVVERKRHSPKKT